MKPQIITKMLPAILSLIFLQSVCTAQPAAELPRRVGSEPAVSPNQPWQTLPSNTSADERPWWGAVLAWFPNRVLDIVDIFRVDVGVGAAAGGVVRISKGGQVGFRSVATSVRVGDFGRTAPLIVETHDEGGAGPDFVESKDRSVCQGEIGLGLDLGLGAYAGICLEEVLDAAAGVFFLDPMGDDLN